MIGQPNRWMIIACSLFALLFMGACEKKDAPQQSAQQTPAPSAPEEKAMAESAPARAVAELKPTEGNEASGTLTLTEQEGGVLVVVDAKGLTPGQHGFHFHEKGDCSAPDATSAGGHFNPESTPHGAPDNPATERHAGDLGNLEAAEDGTAHYERLDPHISLSGPNSVVGKAVIVHAQADDLTSQPTGNAGARVACGVIEAQ
ncbi:hypothetical protein DESUT3_27280 [Desulfuromonas versatilis]|uniref:Superoxide dismutase [Cu-Zn] n=1 Tax=Desulfuromonas versatilis TaxID=2802975 RepID=A0ABN6E2A6_9BACT|nr:superoxide dismutase family protein [Desulfuromonas versatilis]BCR05659.1 hypothetical protein DESUT3_27280 [Desulfuromonas versatilis]